ncbi:hypothetical protein B0A55_08159 [Friedmanniomyces simplex]|uniref:Uncharacterized protein n=1 Tax=Friedmanniomyces simplex TaxID=329884 RepID=A0A4U0WZN6_9PEZI|nr:hypothetical protein B0A55_08159 [Friedmanniomyces simplex]
MSGPPTAHSPAISAQAERRPRALADIQLNTILGADQSTSSEDELPEAQSIPAEDARTALGVSISQHQTRLTSPTTPAVEKAAALAETGGYFGSGFDGIQDSITEESATQDDVGEVAEAEQSAATGEASQERIHQVLQGTEDEPERSPRSPVRFEDVRDQVNSRLKAIKDSWQDSNIKLPSLPSLTSFTPDFMRERSASYSKRQGEGDGNASPPEKPTDPMTRQPYGSVKAAMADAANNKSSSHTHLNSALERLEGDVVVLGGYRGSILRSAEPPHRQVWVPVKVGLNLRKVDLEVGTGAEEDERPSSKIIPGGMLTHIGPVDVARRLFKRLRACENSRQGRLRVHDYGYDWRLNPLYLSKRLVAFLEDLPCNQPGVPNEQRGATVIAHSLGGLITRHALNKRPDLFRGVIYAGVPHTCVNILGPMRNGDEVLLSSRVLTAQVNFTIRTSFAPLPLDGRCFFDKNTKEEYPVDFFDPQTWIEHRLSPCVGRPLPPLSTPEKSSTISGYVSSVTSALPSLSLPSRKNSLSRSSNSTDTSKTMTAGGVVGEPDTMGAGGVRGMLNGNVAHPEKGRESSSDAATSTRTAVTIPYDQAVAYLTRTLALVKQFKEELTFIPSHAAGNKYPPVAVIYGKSTPTVYGAKVNGREGIRHADAYDELAFASGDGVVLARAAMVPEGYTTAKGGVVSSERGHVTLLGDLEAVGRCLNSVIGARKGGVGHGA